MELQRKFYKEELPMNKKPKIEFEKELDKCKTVEDYMGKDGLLQRMVGG